MKKAVCPLALLSFLLSSVSAHSAYQNLQMNVKIVDSAVIVSIKNKDLQTVLLSVAGLADDRAFNFSAVTDDRTVVPLIFVEDLHNRSKVSPGQWVVAMSSGMEYGLTFPLRQLHFKSDRTKSLADLNQPWSVTVEYVALPNRAYSELWRTYHSVQSSPPLHEQPIPFWTGFLKATARK